MVLCPQTFTECPTCGISRRGGTPQLKSLLAHCDIAATLCRCHHHRVVADQVDGKLCRFPPPMHPNESHLQQACPAPDCLSKNVLTVLPGAALVRDQGGRAPPSPPLLISAAASAAAAAARFPSEQETNNVSQSNHPRRQRPSGAHCRSA